MSPTFTLAMMGLGITAGLVVALHGTLRLARARAAGAIEERQVRRIRGLGLPLVAVLTGLFLLMSLASPGWITWTATMALLGLLIGGTFWQVAGRERLFGAGMWLEPGGTVRTFLAELDQYEPRRAADMADRLLAHRHAERGFRALGEPWASGSHRAWARRMSERIGRRTGRRRRRREPDTRVPTDAYRTLKITPDASMREVKRAYRMLAWKYHPDTGRVPDEEKMKAINRAYERIRRARGRKRPM